MSTKRLASHPYAQPNDRHRRNPLRSNSDSRPLHSQPVVGQNGQQARPIFSNGSVNSSTSMLTSLSLPAQMAIESQRRAKSKASGDQKPAFPKSSTPPSSTSDSRDTSERPPSTTSSSTGPAARSTGLTYANVTKASVTKQSSPPSTKSHCSVASQISFIPVPVTRSRAQNTETRTPPPPKNQVLSSNDTKGDAWKAERRTLEKDLERAVTEKNGVLRENENLKKRIANYDNRISSLERTLREERTTSDALKDQLATFQQASLVISEEGNRALKKCRELEERNAGLEAEMQKLKEGAREAEEKQSQLQGLLDSRKQELKTVQVFLTTTDTCSEADVLKLVASLNAEIFQTSAYIAGLVEDLADERVENLTWQQCLNRDTFNLIEARVGRDLLDFIGERGPDNRRDPFPLQLALQAILVWWSTFMVNAFCDNSIGNELATLYRHVKEKGEYLIHPCVRSETQLAAKETQAVAARWRAITIQNLAKFKHETYSSFVQYSIFGILRMAGCCQNLPTSKNATTICESIAVIEKIWKQIRAAVKEGVISCDMELVHGEPGGKFDRTSMDDYYMEDEILDVGSQLDDEPVLCPVAVGVKKSTTKSTDNPQVRSGHNMTLLKPKVVLASALAHMA
ncbi:hypothetical protein CVT24_003494 [Panaeolus cyanescens]|uniref:Uncharacterized protein n=1 Tax=Panaeolus cyanescens TaxID=181874 RepID=A0A409Y7W2_9AGAR|nr:hypothetical protein CVT24_003494 [Panaeolus cyanescens]